VITPIHEPFLLSCQGPASSGIDYVGLNMFAVGVQSNLTLVGEMSLMFIDIILASFTYEIGDLGC
jgi:hypothetical protein